jgi:hypothetical protein
MCNGDISPEVVSEKEEPIQKNQAAALLLVADLGWSDEEAKETRGRLAALEKDWDAPGMDAYDRL